MSDIRLENKENYMNGDLLIWIVLLASLLILNILAISLYTKNKMPLWGSGLIIGILGPIIAFISGSIFVSIDDSMEDEFVGGALAAAFIGLVIAGNGLIYLIIGIIIKIKSFLSQQNLNQ